MKTKITGYCAADEVVEEMSLGEMASLYNTLAQNLPAGERPAEVKRFASRTAATARLEKLQAALATTPAVEPSKPQSKSRSEGIARSWLVEATAAKRCERSAVEVDGVTYRSVRAAFAALALPMEKHISFRIELKAAGELTALGHHWVIIPLNYEG